MRYRTRAIQVDAFQLTLERRLSNEDWPHWMHYAWNTPHEELGSVYPSLYPNSNGRDQLMVRTTLGPVKVDWGDWIIRDNDGLFSVMRPEAFTATFEPLP